MRRLLTGHAMYYNRRHGRCGHLFQNRYRSILCEEERYFLELVRYIHLNPLRANIVRDLKQLDSYLFSGHSYVMGKLSNDWQDTNLVLRLFGSMVRSAKQRYREFISQGVAQGKRPDLVGESMASMARRLNLSTTAISKSVTRGETLVRQGNLLLIDREKFKS